MVFYLKHSKNLFILIFCLKNFGCLLSVKSLFFMLTAPKKIRLKIQLQLNRIELKTIIELSDGAILLTNDNEMY